jgi:hypothetical protein
MQTVFRWLATRSRIIGVAVSVVLSGVGMLTSCASGPASCEADTQTSCPVECAPICDPGEVCPDIVFCAKPPSYACPSGTQAIHDACHPAAASDGDEP